MLLQTNSSHSPHSPRVCLRDVVFLSRPVACRARFGGGPRPAECRGVDVGVRGRLERVVTTEAGGGGWSLGRVVIAQRDHRCAARRKREGGRPCDVTLRAVARVAGERNRIVVMPSAGGVEQGVVLRQLCAAMNAM